MIEFQFGNSINWIKALETAFEKIPLLVDEGEKLKAVLEPPAMADDGPHIPSQSCSWKCEAQPNHLAAIQFRSQDDAYSCCRQIPATPFELLIPVSQ
jgi:hypothetical protein